MEENVSALAARMLVLEREFANLKQATDQQVQRLDNAIGEMRTNLVQLGEKVDDRMTELRNTLGTVTTSALQSMPKWAVEASERKSIIINTLTGLVCALAAGLIELIVYYHH